MEHLRKSLGVSSLAHTFNNFKQVPGTARALQAFKLMPDGNKPLLLCYGGVGNGKTHLCEALAIELYRRGSFVRVLPMGRVMQALKSAIGKDLAFQELLNNYCYAERLILDDVGMGGSGSEWEWRQLEEIVVTRYRERLFTVMTTNLDLKEIPERIASRFFDPDVGIVVLNEGGDYRRVAPQEQLKEK